jgi:hypothetical protein
MIRTAWNFYREMVTNGWSRNDAKLCAAAYLGELRWDAERSAARQAATKRDALMRGGQI